MQVNSETKTMEEREENLRRERLAREVTFDFRARREARRQIENGWTLNVQFMSGNQYCDVTSEGAVEEEDAQYFWQTHRVFNHIAPTVESRVAKLVKARPEVKAIPFSNEDADMRAAQLATGILSYSFERANVKKTVSDGVLWSEICGSVFYKVRWDEKAGRKVGVDMNGEPIFEGEVSVSVTPPYEIFPDRWDCDFSSVQSIIHAQAVDVEYVFSAFGKAVPPDPESEFAGVNFGAKNAAVFETPAAKTTRVQDKKAGGRVILLERYSLPTKEHPNGKLEIVAGETLLYEGELPYNNGMRGERTFPFVKQDCLKQPARFFGTSIVDRLIPVQRAYNAVRNRKHEFLSRLSAGVVAVEDGSVDVDELAEEGLAPGKIVVYRQGSKAPEMMDFGSLPSDFKEEEEWLEKEFSVVSGVSDLSQSSTPTRVTSATGLQLLLSQDDSRMAATKENMREAMTEIARQTVRLYKQFAGNARLLCVAGEGGKTQTYYFSAEELSCDDVLFKAEENMTAEERKETILSLLSSGILAGDDGKISQTNKNRILDAFGLGSYENCRDISALHEERAREENLTIREGGKATRDELDDDEAHIAEHTRYYFSQEGRALGEKEKKALLEHILRHKQAARAAISAETDEKKTAL
ncbi:MAG: hypothetical protein SPH68_03555 [Candidatus Borkfalkiaceae bacterium]|nr:hypothetical protein [Clostridia bacterium]MDY6223222.1 hypothetical protein [Christensenellaceae bacterium]